MDGHLIPIDDQWIYPKVIYKELSLCPSIFEVFKNALLTISLFNLKPFVGLPRLTLYSCIHPRIHLFENTIFFSSGTSFSSCDSHCSWNALHCALNIDFGSLAFKLDRMSMTQSYIAARTSGTDFFLPPPVWRNFTFAGGSVKSLTSKLSRHHFPSLREFDKSGSLCFISFKSE